MGEELVSPFRMDVSQHDLDDLRLRLERTRWPDDVTGADYGMPQSYVRRLFNRWVDGYDWRAWEARLNRYAQFETTIDGQHIHFLHVRSPREDGWTNERIARAWAALLGEDLEDDFALTNVMMYWLMRTGSSAGRLYYENARAPRPTAPTTLPLGLAGFGGDFFGLRRFAKRDHANIVHWKTYDRGGHFAAHKVPELYFGDVREFFRSIVR